jgi:hypothetical protein
MNRKSLAIAAALFAGTLGVSRQADAQVITTMGVTPYTGASYGSTLYAPSLGTVYHSVPYYGGYYSNSTYNYPYYNTNSTYSHPYNSYYNYPYSSSSYSYPTLGSTYSYPYSNSYYSYPYSGSSYSTPYNTYYSGGFRRGRLGLW